MSVEICNGAYCPAGGWRQTETVLQQSNQAERTYVFPRALKSNQVKEFYEKNRTPNLRSLSVHF